MIVRVPRPKSFGSISCGRPKGARGRLATRLAPLQKPDEERKLCVGDVEDNDAIAGFDSKETHRCDRKKEDDDTIAAETPACFDSKDRIGPTCHLPCRTDWDWRNASGGWVAEPTFVPSLLRRCPQHLHLTSRPSLSSVSSACSTPSSCSSIATSPEQSSTESEDEEPPRRHDKIVKSPDQIVKSPKRVHVIGLQIPLMRGAHILHPCKSARRSARILRSTRASRSRPITDPFPISANEDMEIGLGRCHPPAYGDGDLPEGVGIELQMHSREASPVPLFSRRAVSGSFIGRVSDPTATREVSFKTFCLPTLELVRRKSNSRGNNAYFSEEQKLAFSQREAFCP